MKVVAIMALFIMQVCLFSVSLSAQKPAKYYDAAGKELSKTEFYQLERTPDYLGVIVDSSANAHQLVRREEWGVLPSAEDIYSKLETATGKNIDRNKYLLILYYPGKDRCNSSGLATPASTTRERKRRSVSTPGIPTRPPRIREPPLPTLSGRRHQPGGTAMVAVRATGMVPVAMA